MACNEREDLCIDYMMWGVCLFLVASDEIVEGW